MEKGGKEGVITVEEAKAMETTLETVEGCSSTAATSLQTYDCARYDTLVYTFQEFLSCIQSLMPL